MIFKKCLLLFISIQVFSTFMKSIKHLFIVKVTYSRKSLLTHVNRYCSTYIEIYVL